MHALQPRASCESHAAWPHFLQHAVEIMSAPESEAVPMSVEPLPPRTRKRRQAPSAAGSAILAEEVSHPGVPGEASAGVLSDALGAADAADAADAGEDAMPVHDGLGTHLAAGGAVEMQVDRRPLCNPVYTERSRPVQYECACALLASTPPRVDDSLRTDLDHTADVQLHACACEPALRHTSARHRAPPDAYCGNARAQGATRWRRRLRRWCWPCLIT